MKVRVVVVAAAAVLVVGFAYTFIPPFFLLLVIPFRAPKVGHVINYHELSSQKELLGKEILPPLPLKDLLMSKIPQDLY